MHVSTASALVALVSASTAPPTTITLDLEKGPNPIGLKGPSLPLTKRQDTGFFGACTNPVERTLSAAPSVKLVLPKKARIRLESLHSFGLAIAGGKQLCFERPNHAKKGQVFRAGTFALPAGEHLLYPMGNQGQSKSIRIAATLLDRVPVDAKRALGRASPIAVSDETTATENPARFSVSVKGAFAFEPDDLNMGCAGVKYLLPITTLKVRAAGNFLLGSRMGAVYLQTKTGKCISGGGELEAGEYGVFADMANYSETTEVTVLDTERALRFAEAKTIPASLAKGPAVAEVAVTGPGRATPGLCGPIQAKPSLYFDVKDSVDVARIAVLVGPKSLSITAVGPLGTKKARCMTGSAPLFEADKGGFPAGRYAVWVMGKAGDAPQAAYVVAKTPHGDGDPLEQLGSVAEDLPLPKRLVWWFYPFYDRQTAGVEPLFLRAPPQLFVFLKSETEGVAPGEPLLLAEYGEKRSVLVRATGERVTVRSRLLTTTRPSRVVAPKRWPKIERPPSIFEARKVAPTLRKAFAKWQKAEDTRYACVARYMKKNDPSWGKDYELISRRTGETASNIYFKKADRKCKTAKVERAAEKLLDKTVSARKKLRKELEKGLARRFR